MELTAEIYAIPQELLDFRATIRQIAHAAWGLWAKRATENVRVYISLLRRKLEPDPARPRWLVTRWGAGYCLLSSPAGE